MRDPADQPPADPTAEAELDPRANVADRASLARALRDLEAAKARVERDAQAVLADTRKKLVVELLPVLDNLDRSIRAARASGDAPAVLEGSYLVRGQLEAVLRGYGVSRLDATNQRFDPAIHEAVSVIAVAQPAAHNVVIDQLEPGYEFGDALLRPAKVVVGRYTAPAPAPRPPARWH